jgi:hypothetical protein
MIIKENTRAINLSSYFYCSARGELLTNPQILNCKNYDRINLVFAISKFGNIVNDTCEKIGRCPICKKKVTYYESDTWLREQVWNFLCMQLKPMTIMKILKMKNFLWLKNVEQHIYPYKKGNFMVGNESRIYHHQNYFAIILNNESESPEVSHIYLIRDSSNSSETVFKIEILLNNQNFENFTKCLIQNNIDVPDQQNCKNILSLNFSKSKANLDGLILLFYVFLANNEFSGDSKEILLHYLSNVLDVMQTPMSKL